MVSLEGLQSDLFSGFELLLLKFLDLRCKNCLGWDSGINTIGLQQERIDQTCEVVFAIQKHPDT